MSEWDEVVAAIGRAQQGDAGGRDALLAHWGATSSADHARRCVLAHYLADLEPEPADEVAWDEIALAEFGHLADGDLAVIGIPSVEAMAPSLHLNLADGYLRLGRVDDARHSLERGRAAAGALADDGYGAMIRRGLDGVADRLGAADAPPALDESTP